MGFERINRQDSQAYYKNSQFNGAIASNYSEMQSKLAESLEKKVVLVIGESLRWAPDKSRRFSPKNIAIATKKHIVAISVITAQALDTFAIRVVEFREK